MKFLFKRPSSIPVPEAPKSVAGPAVAPAPAAPVAPVSAVPVPAPEPAPVAAPLASGKGGGPYRQDHRSLYKQLLRGMYDAVLVTDPKGHVIDSNLRVQEFFHYDPNEVWDLEISKLIPGITMQLLERVKQGLSESRHVLMDARCVRKDGHSFPAEVAISSLDLINEGDVVFSVRNIERRKRQSQLLRSLQNAMANDLSAIAVCDNDGQIIYANHALRTLWACEKDEQIIGKQLTSLWPDDPQGAEPIRRARSGERWMGMLDARAFDGRRFQVGVAMDVDRPLEGTEVVGLVCSFVEVHE
jgi:PAS domain S-box-containing protein